MDKELKRELDSAVIALAKAKALIDEGELIKKDVKEKIMPLMESFGVKSNEVEGVGKLVLATGGGSSIPPKKITEVLLNEGVDADLVPDILKKATKTWKYSYLTFTKPKRKP